MAQPYQDVVVLGANGHGKTTLVTTIGDHAAWQRAAFKLHDGFPSGTARGGAIVVVDAKDGILAKTRDDIAAARGKGLAWIVGYISKADLIDADDAELLDLLEMECREMFAKYGFPSDTAAILRGAASDPARAHLDELLAACTRARG
jgi:translation elongation factor EF-Tu-like GTPase